MSIRMITQSSLEYRHIVKLAPSLQNNKLDIPMSPELPTTQTCIPKQPQQMMPDRPHTIQKRVDSKRMNQIAYLIQNAAKKDQNGENAVVGKNGWADIYHWGGTPKLMDSNITSLTLIELCIVANQNSKRNFSAPTFELDNTYQKNQNERTAFACQKN